MAKNSAEFHDPDPLDEAVEHDEPELPVETRLAQFSEKLDQALHGLVKDDPNSKEDDNPVVIGLKGIKEVFDALEHPSPEARQELAAVAAPQALKELNQALGLADPNPSDPAQAGMQFLEKAMTEFLAKDEAFQADYRRSSVSAAHTLMVHWNNHGYENPLDYEMLQEIRATQDPATLCNGVLLMTGQNFGKSLEALGLNPATGLEFRQDEAKYQVLPQIQGNENPVYDQVIFEAYSNLAKTAWQNQPEAFQRAMNHQPYVDESLSFHIQTDTPADRAAIYFDAQFTRALDHSKNPWQFQQMAFYGAQPGPFSESERAAPAPPPRRNVSRRAG